MNNIGYCCINLSLNEGRKKVDQISVNRGMTKKTFEKRGLDWVSELCKKNIDDLFKILEWNWENSILVYRMSSEMLPCLGFYNLEDLPDFSTISKKLFKIGEWSREKGMRLSFHPSHFCIIASENEKVVQTAIDELDKHAQIMDLMGLDKNHFYPINIHIGVTKPTKQEAAERFCKKFELLSESCKSRLTVENDDGPNQFSVKDLWELVHAKIGIPIVFDQHHFNCGPKDLSMEESLILAHSTWKTKPLTHMSSSRRIEDPKSGVRAHADLIWERILTFGLEFDTEIEAKLKDVALLHYRNNFS